MKENRLPGPSRDPSRWGKWLLTASLLVVAVQGVFHLYEVQSVFFPGVYHATELNLINKESIKIENTLQNLKVLLDKLQSLCPIPAQGQAAPSGSGSSASVQGEARGLVPAWEYTLYLAKKQRVNAARKLNYIDVILKSMQRSLRAQLSDNSKASMQKPEIEKTLRQIRQERAHWRIYDDRLNKLSQTLVKLEERVPGSATETRY
jgi:hypothetical protein